jgi:hypothetical protein
MPIDPLAKLAETLADSEHYPEQMTNLTIKEQLALYMAEDFASSKNGYELEFLQRPLLTDQLSMMAAPPSKRNDQIVEAIKALQQPLGIDTGLQSDAEGGRRRRRR